MLHLLTSRLPRIRPESCSRGGTSSAPRVRKDRSGAPSLGARLGLTQRCYDDFMPKTRTTLTIDEDLLTAIKVEAARSGKGDSQVIEEALRRDLGFDLLDEIWQRATLTEQEAMNLSREAQEAARHARS